MPISLPNSRSRPGRAAEARAGSTPAASTTAPRRPWPKMRPKPL